MLAATLQGFVVSSMSCASDDERRDVPLDEATEDERVDVGRQGLAEEEDEDAARGPCARPSAPDTRPENAALLRSTHMNVQMTICGLLPNVSETGASTSGPIPSMAK